jgi:hypothetical protein
MGRYVEDSAGIEARMTTGGPMFRIMYGIESHPVDGLPLHVSHDDWIAMGDLERIIGAAFEGVPELLAEAAAVCPGYHAALLRLDTDPRAATAVAPPCPPVLERHRAGLQGWAAVICR